MQRNFEQGGRLQSLPNQRVPYNWREKIISPKEKPDRPSFVPKLWDSFNEDENKSLKCEQKSLYKQHMERKHYSNARPKSDKNKDSKSLDSKIFNLKKQSKIPRLVSNLAKPVFRKLMKPECVPKLWDEWSEVYGPIFHDGQKTPPVSVKETRAKLLDLRYTNLSYLSDFIKPVFAKLPRPDYVPKLWDEWDEVLGPVFLHGDDCESVVEDSKILTDKTTVDLRYNGKMVYASTPISGEQLTKTKYIESIYGTILSPVTLDGSLEKSSSSINVDQTVVATPVISGKCTTLEKLRELDERCNRVKDSFDIIKKQLDIALKRYAADDTAIPSHGEAEYSLPGIDDFMSTNRSAAEQSLPGIDDFMSTNRSAAKHSLPGIDDFMSTNRSAAEHSVPGIDDFMSTNRSASNGEDTEYINLDNLSQEYYSKQQMQPSGKGDGLRLQEILKGYVPSADDSNGVSNKRRLNEILSEYSSNHNDKPNGMAYDQPMQKDVNNNYRYVANTCVLEDLSGLTVKHEIDRNWATIVGGQLENIMHVPFMAKLGRVEEYLNINGSPWCRKLQEFRHNIANIKSRGETGERQQLLKYFILTNNIVNHFYCNLLQQEMQ